MCYVGIDIGAVSATAALISTAPLAGHLTDGKLQPLDLPQGPRLPEESAVCLSPYLRTRGKPLAAATELLEGILRAVGASRIAGVRLTGSGSEAVSAALEADTVNEFRAVALGIAALGIEARTVFEMGGESSKFLRLDHSDGAGIVDYATNGDCAAGTGSFIDQQCGRLRYDVEAVSDIVASAERAAQVAGRCSVFAKSDMIHAQQKGYAPPEVLGGLCNAVARNFRAAVVRSHAVQPPVAFVGGVAANTAVVAAIRQAFDLDESQLIVPPAHAHLPAIGAAAAAMRDSDGKALGRMNVLRQASDTSAAEFPRTAPLSMDNVVLLRDRVAQYEHNRNGDVIDAYLGIDIGSVSTNVVVIDATGRVVTEIYTPTKGRPIEVVGDALRQIEAEWGDRLTIRGAGTTGSGRELIGELIGADTINDEITAHKTGATYVGRTLLGGRLPDTIFEIGGQDSKYISLQGGVVVDFTMNEACAAGTGSFLEERAEELDIAITDEFAEMALASNAPVRLGERCTVFMERDVNSYLQRGAAKGDLVAGLAYSVVYNYINRVVRGRPVGDCVFFQGGTAYNDSVAAAFAAVTGKEIIVPPHNGVIGAIGAALLAREKMDVDARALGRSVDELHPARVEAVTAQNAAEGVYVPDHTDAPSAKTPVTVSAFRGYDMAKIDYALREFTCKGCSNTCQIQEFDVEGSKTYWGDKCSDRYRKRAKTARRPIIEDIFALRENWLFDDAHLPPADAGAPTVGIPLTMFAWEQLPFWRTLLAGMGFATVLSDPTNKAIIQAGLDSAVAEPCFPIIVGHGHVANLAEAGVDHILLPNILSLESPQKNNNAFLCPWHQTLPFVCRRAPALRQADKKLLGPLIQFQSGPKHVAEQIKAFFKPMGISPRRAGRATADAYAAQETFRKRLLSAGREAVETLDRENQTGVIIVGRPYNIHDAGVNLSVARKLRDTYGVNCLPMDCLDTDIDIVDTNSNMYWELGRRIMAIGKIVSHRPNLHIIYVTNFKCGPDSFIKHFLRKASGKPFLALQFDGHSNDAGVMTRCEAYLDSKGLLRQQQPAASASQPS
ncbi:MAG: acyl-CoA dehydratase activase [Planctomycetota bacterium]|jgi:predicted CoA-substrate-specific enzyme activase